jgi:hypothetical protein
MRQGNPPSQIPSNATLGLVVYGAGTQEVQDLARLAKLEYDFGS